MKRIIIGLTIIMFCISLCGCNSTLASTKDNTVSEINNLYVKLNDLKTNINDCGSFEEMKSLLSNEKELFTNFSSLEIKPETEVGKCVEKIRSYEVYKLFESDYVTLKILSDMKDNEDIYQDIFIQVYKELFATAIDSILEIIPDKYIESGVKENNTEIKQIEESTTISNVSTKNDYIKDFLSIESATVTMCEGYNGKEPGLMNVAIKNNGEKNVQELTVTVFFQDESGKDIAEDSIMLIGGYFGGNTLKANYSWKMENDEYYAFKNLSNEVDINRNRIEITEISFD